MRNFDVKKITPTISRTGRTVAQIPVKANFIFNYSNSLASREKNEEEASSGSFQHARNKGCSQHRSARNSANSD